MIAQVTVALCNGRHAAMSSVASLSFASSRGGVCLLWLSNALSLEKDGGNVNLGYKVLPSLVSSWR